MQEKKSKVQLRASLTVEASLVLPVLVFAIAGLLYYIQILNIQQKLQFAIVQTAWEASEYGFIYNDLLSGEKDAGNGENAGAEGIVSDSENAGAEASAGSEAPSVVRQLLDGSFYSIAAQKYVDSKWIDDSCVLGGYAGLSFYGSRFMEDGENIRVALSYRVKIPFPIFSFFSFPINQQVNSRAFVGMGEGEGSGLTGESETEAEEDKTVYITQTGTKYHLKEDCTYLKPSISCVSFSELDKKRNGSGGKYYACEKCGKWVDEAGGCYITKEGDRYHSSLSCSGIKRTVIPVKLKEALNQGKTPCSKCG